MTDEELTGIEDQAKELRLLQSRNGLMRVVLQEIAAAGGWQGDMAEKVLRLCEPRADRPAPAEDLFECGKAMQVQTEALEGEG